MTFVIENEKMSASFNSKGAELVSLKLKEDNSEYLWQGDPAYWGRQAPVLFPFVGRLKEDRYTYEGKTYSMGQHGFARDMDFDLIRQTQTEIAFSLKSSTETRKMYPFDFELILSYQVKNQEIICRYEVRNSGKKKMYFSIGGHPAFTIPMSGFGEFNDYYLRFSPKKSRLEIPLEGSYVNMNEKTLGQTNTDLSFSRETFKNDAVIYEVVGQNSFEIRSDVTDKRIKLSVNQMPYVGFWSLYPLDAPFVCIEPWCGIADTTDATGNLEDKLGINTLESEEIFKREYSIEIR